MSESIFFGSLSIGFMAISRLMYLRTIVRGNTRPHVFSWLIWLTISSIGFAAQYLEGAGAGAWARGFAAISCGLITILAIFYGESRITRGDSLTLAVALVTIPIWIITETPLWSVTIVCFIDTLGYLPTLRKSWTKPREEFPAGYLASGMGAACSLLAIEHYVIVTWLYPAVLVITNGSFFAYLVSRQRLATD